MDGVISGKPEISAEGRLAVREYIRLEKRVGRLAAAVYAPFCAACGSCCRRDICVESVERFWLRLVRETNAQDTARFGDDTGWLTPAGCGLTAGRPPLCYEFFCNEAAREIERHPLGHPLKELSRLMNATGQRALGNTHLVALSSGQIVKKLNFRRLRGRIAKSRKLCDAYEKSLWGRPSDEI